MSSTHSFEGKHVVVIGGTSGMGRAVALAAHEEGAQVTVAGRRAPAASAPRFRHEQVDVSDEAQVKALFARVGALDHLVVTAAPAPGASRPFLQDDVAGAASYLHAKFFGSWASARYAAPHMPPTGSITFLTGGIVARPKAGASIVAATFAALEKLGTALAIELAPLRVNTLRPGYTDSEMWGFLDEGARARLFADVAARMPSRRVGTPADVAHAALFLMSNPQVTGSVLEVTGGETLVDGL